jgi:hypothetical protein
MRLSLGVATTASEVKSMDEEEDPLVNEEEG